MSSKEAVLAQDMVCKYALPGTDNPCELLPNQSGISCAKIKLQTNENLIGLARYMLELNNVTAHGTGQTKGKDEALCVSSICPVPSAVTLINRRPFASMTFACLSSHALPAFSCMWSWCATVHVKIK